MISAVLALFLTFPFLMLRLSESGGAFQKPLSPKEESEYIERLAAGDEEARRILIERNLRLVAHIMKKYYTRESDREDLISIGTIGLIKGVSTYKPERKVHLSTYVSRCIENEILMHFRGRKKSGGDVSLSEPIDTDLDGSALTLIDLISVEDDMLDRISAEETRCRLERYIGESLTEREADIVSHRYGLAGLRPLTQREVAAARGISRSYVYKPAYYNEWNQERPFIFLYQKIGQAYTPLHWFCKGLWLSCYCLFVIAQTRANRRAIRHSYG